METFGLALFGNITIKVGHLTEILLLLRSHVFLQSLALLRVVLSLRWRSISASVRIILAVELVNLIAFWGVLLLIRLARARDLIPEALSAE